MPVQSDSIIYCIKYTKPQKEQNCSHLFSIIPGKEPAKEHETKSENEATKRQAKKQHEPRKRRKKTKRILHNYQHYCTSHSNHIYTSYHVLN